MSQAAATIANYAKQVPMLFRQGMLVIYNQEKYSIRNAEPDYMVLQHVLNKQVLMLQAQQWSDAYNSGELTLVEEPNPVVIQPITNKALLDKGERMLAYILELDCRAKPGSEKTWQAVIAHIAPRISDSEPPHPKQIYRWYQKWKRFGKNIGALLQQKQRRTRPVTDAQLDFAMKVIDEHFLVPQGGNRSALYRMFRAEFELESNRERFELTDKPMSKSALDNLLDTLDPFEVTVSQKGLSVARSKFRDSNEKIVVGFPGERVEIDAVHLNLGVVAPETGEYHGKIILFLAIDVYTRYIVGYTIVYGTEPAESAEGAINLIRHIVSEKPNNGNFQTAWHCLGIPHCIHADNGPAFIAESTLRFCTSLNVDLHRSESRKSQRRPFIERFNRTLREQLMVKIPGYLGKRTDETDFGKTVEQAAVVSLDEFKQYLEEFICDVYHQNPHKGLDGLSPAQKLEQASGHFLPRPVADMAKLNALVGNQYTRTIQATHGIQIENLNYHSTELKLLRAKLQKNRKTEKPVSVEVIFNSNDISSVTVLVPDALESLIVPLRDKTIEPGTSLKAYRAQKALAKRGFEAAPHKEFSLKSKPRRKPSASRKSPVKSSTAPQSEVVNHTPYDVDKTMAEATTRLATDESARVPVDNKRVDLRPAPSHSAKRKPSGSR